jgi:hypothetical protein
MTRQEAFPTEADVKRVFEILHPSSELAPACREATIDALRMIKTTNPNDFPSVGATRTKLDKVATTSKTARAAICNLPSYYRLTLDPGGLLCEQLERVHRASKEFTSKIVVRRSGGRRAAAQLKLIAAGHAVYLLMYYSERKRTKQNDLRWPATLTRRGTYFKLAGLLFEIATGLASGDMERACGKCVDQYLRELQQPRELTEEQVGLLLHEYRMR